jgi:hypothetical protein
MLIFGINSWVYWVLGDRVLKLRNDPRYLGFRERRRLSRLDWKVSLAFLLIPLLAWAFAVLGAPLLIRVYGPGPAEMLIEVFVSVWLGGMLFVFLGHLTAVVLIRCGIDPEKNWLDELIVIPLGVLVLLRFGNEPWSIASYVLVSLIPEIILRRQRPGEGQTTRKRRAGCLIWLAILALFIAVGVTSNRSKKTRPPNPPPAPAKQ